MEKSKNWKKYLKIVLQLIIYSLVTYYIFNRLSENWSVFEKIDVFFVPFFILSILIFSLHAIWNGFIWHYLINSKGYNLSLMGQMDVYLRSHILRYIPGNVIGILSRAIFNRVYGVPILKSLFAWFYENLSYLVIGSVIASFIVIRVGKDWFIFEAIPSVPFFITIVILGFLVVLNVDWFENLFKRFLLPRLPEKIKKETDILNIPLKKRIKIFLGFVVSWIIYSASFLSLVVSIKPSLLDTNILEIVSINALSWVLGYISLVTPSGSGVREFIMIFSLENFMNVDVEIAIILALLARIVSILGELLSLGFFFSFKYILSYIKRT
jgi:glycosyltransferase 2 family protein